MDKLDVANSALTTSASFDMDLGIDSLDLFEVMMEVERQFNIEISTEDAEKIQTVGALIRYY